MIFWLVLSPKSLIAVISQRSESLAVVAPNRGCGTLLLVPRVWPFMLGKDSAPSRRASRSVLAMNPVCFVCSRINNFYVYAFYRNPGHDCSLYDYLLDSMARVQSFDKAVFAFVDDSNAHHSEWLESVSTDRHRRDALDFCTLSSCVQLVRCPTHFVGNRPDLVITDSPDIVDVFVCTPLGTSDHCLVSCVLRV